MLDLRKAFLSAFGVVMGDPTPHRVIVEDPDNIGYALVPTPSFSAVVSGPGLGYMGPWKRTAPNGEGVIDVHANRKALFDIAPLEFWKDCERRAHAD